MLGGPLTGQEVAGVFYGEMGTPPLPGEVVVANTVGLEMGLGTGGLAVILPRTGGEAPTNEEHFVKLPYTPLQFPAELPLQARGLKDVPVAVLPLHSHLAPACCAAAALQPGLRVSFVWQEGGALPVGMSQVAKTLKEKDLLHAVVSVGNCFGGDLESPNAYAGLLAAAAAADLVLVGIGPGVVGTGSKYGHGGMSAATALNAAFSLGGYPVLAPRISHRDDRDRHRGVSHHTRTALEATLRSCRVAVPASASVEATSDLPEDHFYVEVSANAAGLEERFGLVFESMGRSYSDDPVFFDAAVAAVTLALGETL